MSSTQDANESVPENALTLFSVPGNVRYSKNRILAHEGLAARGGNGFSRSSERRLIVLEKQGAY